MTRARTAVASLAALALSATLTAGVAAQAETEPAGTFPIEEVNWLLSAQVVDGEMTPLGEGIVISLRMADGKADGTGGCNHYGGSYELDGSDVAIQLLFHSQVGCIPSRAAAEQAYFASLDRVTSYQSGDGHMALEDEAGELLMEFSLAPPSTVEGSWTASLLSDGEGGLEGNRPISRATATFGPDGSLTGTDGCNDFSATYELDGQDIRIGRIAVTEKQCDRWPTRFARRYIAALEATATWSIGMSGLELRDDEGAVQVTYHRTD